MSLHYTAPVKDWVRRLSPAKARDKPLPPAPDLEQQQQQQQQQHDARPFRTRCANVSAPAAPTATTKKPQKLHALFGPSSKTEAAAPSPGATAPRPGPSRGRMSLGVLTQSASSAIHRSHRSRHASPDLRRLSRKVSSLEAEVEKARRELQAALGHAPRSESVERERRADELRSARADRQQQAGRSSRRATFEVGFAETLLRQSDLVNRGSSEPSSVQTLSPESLKRKRSELREASWSHIQQMLQIENAQQQQQQPNPKRPRHAASHTIASGVSSTEAGPFTSPPDRAFGPTDQTRDRTAEPVRPKTRHGKTDGPTTVHERPLPFLPAPNVRAAPLTTLNSVNWTVFPGTRGDRRPEPLPPAAPHSRSFVDDKPRHRPGRSLVLARGAREEERRAPRSADQSHRAATRVRTRLPPSPRKPACPSPSRLHAVEEEIEEGFEWPADVF